MKALFTILVLGGMALAQTAAKPAAPAQKPTSPPAGRSSSKQPGNATKAKPAPAKVEPDDGWIDGRLYTSDYFHFTYVLPEKFDVEEEFMANTEESDTTFVLLAAANAYDAEDQRSVLVLIADKPPANITTPLQYVEHVSSDIATHQGFQTVAAGRELTIAGHKFARADYRKGATFQTAIFTLSRGYALGFNLASPTQAGLQTMIDSLATLRFLPTAPAPARKP